MLGRLLSVLDAPDDAEIGVAAAGQIGVELVRFQEARPDGICTRGAEGRGLQLSAGAYQSCGRWLWLLHADCLPPPDWPDLFRRLDQGPPVVRRQLPLPAGLARQASSPARARRGGPGDKARDALRGSGNLHQPTGVRTIGGIAAIPLMEDVERIAPVKRRGRLRHHTTEVDVSPAMGARRMVRPERSQPAHVGALPCWGVPGVAPDAL